MDLGIILLAYLLISAGLMALAFGGATYYLEKEYYRKLLAAGVAVTLAGLGMLAYFLMNF